MTPFVPRKVDPEVAARLSRELGLHPVTAQVLAGRNLYTPELAQSFLRPGFHKLHDPSLLPDMDRAVSTLADALGSGARIAVYGDYDVDGVCATAVMTRALRGLGGSVRPFIPHRVKDGYGLNGEALAHLAEEGCQVIVTVDNGSTRAAEVEEAARRGTRVVVTDHHECAPELPPCPLVNPKRPDSAYPFPGLAGCGVAFKLALALFERLGRMRDPAIKPLLPELTALTAVGTVADVVPLIDENRDLVALGLKALGATAHPGVRALLEVSRCTSRALRASDVAYRIGPRINAAGRLRSAHLALDLLLCEDPAEAARLANQLDEGNRERQSIERRHADEAVQRAKEELARTDSPALVLADPDWHPGVIGIVASRVAETFHRPAALISIDGEEARGSARSFGGVALHEALGRCSQHLTTHGGHANAAGFTLPAAGVEAFRDAFLGAVAEIGPSESGPRAVDAELPVDAITPSLAAEIATLEPFGLQNEEPVFCAYRVHMAGKPRRLGAGEKHLSFYAAGERSAVRAVGFHLAGKEPLLSRPFDFCFVLRSRSGPEPVELHVKDIAPSA